MVWSLAEDLKFGKLYEKVVVQNLNENIYFNDEIKMYENEMKQVDFRNKEIIGELKTRTNSKDRYSTTMFGYNKIKYLKSLENDNRVWKFYFLFTDGLYVWSYNEDQYEIEEFNHRERGVIDNVYIPVKYLECISRKINSKMSFQEQIEYINRKTEQNDQSS